MIRTVMIVVAMCMQRSDLQRPRIQKAISLVCDRPVTWSTLVIQQLCVEWRHFRSCF